MPKRNDVGDVKKLYSPRSNCPKRLEDINNLLYNNIGLTIEFGKTLQSIKYIGEYGRSLFHYYTPTASDTYNPYNGEDVIEFLSGNPETIEAFNSKKDYSQFPYRSSKYGISFPFCRLDDTSFTSFIDWLKTTVKKI